ncbi:hypothetical protein MYCTH_2304243 [Thermothelomyces thermophilus ATCC 42464]|uniref:Guanine nucleotide-exchange factor SEC12 n=1 Tax=Thermothelomyces thermophilus (strain ATCC 42464 / BCRC 31852 / DSM 1799) TaxID=573729 RepID=G2QED5_THET4|nr:uncharacterized protein MYCTH_2304243 [Thermothelomyces thermophilus ATCC 42464]AEO57718.1 hypothetical protein MYCTH_2304243 [Thermothelomyces thermophilus ATCC 42464]
MAPPIPRTEVRLSYPLYALDFDPEDANRLIVGGGGGAARSGVGNKISVLDASHDAAPQIVSEIELGRDEDSVNTLVVGSRRNNALLLYAGINSAEEDLKKGKNEHFRVFAADLPSGAKEQPNPKIAEISRSALFSTTDTDAYQRLLRISGPVGAAATGSIGRSNDPQIAVFDMPAATSNSPAPQLRGKVELPKEAQDMDMMQVSDDEHQLVYCDNYDIYTLVVTKTATSGPHAVWSMPLDAATGAKDRPSLRCIRFLTPTFVLAVANIKSGGAVLQGFRLPNRSDLGKEEKEGKARLAISAKLPKSIRRATSMAVRNLSPPASPFAKQDETQFVIAVTGQDSSITLYTLDHQSIGDINLISNLYPVTTFKEVHAGPISGLAFSSITPSATAGKQQPQQPPHIKLASIGSMANTCVVHSLPLRPRREQEQQQQQQRRRQQQQEKQQGAPGYTLALKPRRPSPASLLLTSALVFALLALLLQGVLEVKGLSRPVIGARSVTPVRWHSPGRFYGVAVEARAEAAAPSPLPVAGVLAEYHEAKKALQGKKTGAGAGAGEKKEDGEEGEEEEKTVVVVLHHVAEEEVVIRVEGHDAARHGEAKSWEELAEEQKQKWKAALKRAGQWGEEMGEAAFKGILFAEIPAAVGAMVA